VTHYRFSVAWTRVLPNGTADNINDKGKYIELVLSLSLCTKLQKINKMTKREEKCWSREMSVHVGWSSCCLLVDKQR